MTSPCTAWNSPAKKHKQNNPPSVRIILITHIGISFTHRSPFVPPIISTRPRLSSQTRLYRLCRDLLSPAQIAGMEKGGQMHEVWTLHETGSKGEPLPCSTPSSVNDSYSACVVVYSFPAVKGCPLKVPFVHRLHFVIQINPFFFDVAQKVAGCPHRVRSTSARQPLSSAFETNPLHCTSSISYLPFHIYIYNIYIVQKETGVN